MHLLSASDVSVHIKGLLRRYNLASGLSGPLSLMHTVWVHFMGYGRMLFTHTIICNAAEVLLEITKMFDRSADIA